jgi:hypothetical protein
MWGRIEGAVQLHGPLHFDHTGGVPGFLKRRERKEEGSKKNPKFPGNFFDFLVTPLALVLILDFIEYLVDQTHGVTFFDPQ